MGKPAFALKGFGGQAVKLLKVPKPTIEIYLAFLITAPTIAQCDCPC